MSDDLDVIVRLVADGKLTPDEAAPIIAALSRVEPALAGASTERRPARQLRIRITERGRQVVNLRIPIGVVDSAVQMVPGLWGDHSQRIRDAISAGELGAIVDVEESDGSGVLISLE